MGGHSALVTGLDDGPSVRQGHRDAHAAKRPPPRRECARRRPRSHPPAKPRGRDHVRHCRPGAGCKCSAPSLTSSRTRAGPSSATGWPGLAAGRARRWRELFRSWRRPVSRTGAAVESPVTQGDVVGLGDAVGLDSPQAFAQAFASLPQELERVGGATLGSGPLQISSVLLDEVCLKSCSDFVGCLQSVLDGPVSRGVVNHAASIAPIAGSLCANTATGLHATAQATRRLPRSQQSNDSFTSDAASLPAKLAATLRFARRGTFGSR